MSLSTALEVLDTVRLTQSSISLDLEVEGSNLHVLEAHASSFQLLRENFLANRVDARCLDHCHSRADHFLANRNLAIPNRSARFSRTRATWARPARSFH